MTQWSIADIMTGKMLIGGPRLVAFCPDPKCGSPNVDITGPWGAETLKCSSCGAVYSGAAVRV